MMNEIQRDEILHDRYKIIKAIGAGASSNVYKALDTATGEYVVIKLISRKNHSLFANEISILKQLRNMYIIKYLDSFVEGVKMCLVLEYAEGGSLFKTLQKFGCLPENIVKKYVKNVLCALIDIHSKNLVHRDIKSSNVLIKDGIAKIGDFGISGNVNDGEFPYLEGSPYWMSPESIISNKPTTKSDIWAIGALLIELITGNPPFHNYPVHSVLLMLQEYKVPSIPSNVSPLCSSFINLCFTKNPDERPTASDLLYHPWLKDIQESEYDYPEEYIYNLERKYYFNNISLKLLGLLINNSEIYIKTFIELDGNTILLKNCHNDKYKNCSIALIKTLASFSKEYSNLDSSSKLIQELIDIFKKEQNISDSCFEAISILLLLINLSNKNMFDHREISNLFFEHQCEKFVFPFLIIFFTKINDFKFYQDILYKICLYVLNCDPDCMVKLLMEIDWSSEVSSSLKEYYSNFYHNIVLESIDKSLQVIINCIKMNTYIPQIVYCFENTKILNVSSVISERLEYIFQCLINKNDYFCEKCHIDLIFNSIKNKKELMKMFIDLIHRMLNDDLFRKEFSTTKCYKELIRYNEQHYNIFSIYLSYDKYKYRKEMDILFININPMKVLQIACLIKEFPNDEIIHPSHFKNIIEYYIQVYSGNEESTDILDNFNIIFSSSEKLCLYFQESNAYQFFIKNIRMKNSNFLDSYLNIIYTIIMRQDKNTIHLNNSLFRQLLFLKSKYGEKFSEQIDKIFSIISS